MRDAGYGVKRAACGPLWKIGDRPGAAERRRADCLGYDLFCVFFQCCGHARLVTRAIRLIGGKGARFNPQPNHLCLFFFFFRWGMACVRPLRCASRILTVDLPCMTARKSQLLIGKSG
jgi:hypothetical protein